MVHLRFPVGSFYRTDRRQLRGRRKGPPDDARDDGT